MAKGISSLLPTYFVVGQPVMFSTRRMSPSRDLFGMVRLFAFIFGLLTYSLAD